MKKFKLLIAVVLLPIMFIACGGGAGSSDDGTYTMSVLPTKYAIDVPAAISGTASKSASKSILKVDTGTPSQGCQQMKSMTGIMKQMTGMMGFFAVLADASISQNNIAADETEHDGTVTLTKEMIDAVAVIMPADMGDTSQLAGAIGQSMPAMVTYSDNGTDDYVYSVLLTMTSVMGSQSAKIYWNEAKTNTKLELTMEGNTLTFTYDDTAKLMTAKMASTSGTMEMSLKEDGTGALFFANMEAAGLGTFRMEGFADDNGGYIKTTMISSSFGTMISNETFDASGNTTAGNDSYSAAYTSGAGDISTLQGEIGISVTTSLPAGEYLILTASSFDGILDSEVEYGAVVGYGAVTGTSLRIQDIGGAAYTESGTVYLYKVDGSTPFFSQTPPTIGTTANLVTL